MNADKESLPVSLQLHNQVPVASARSTGKRTWFPYPCPSFLRICSCPQYLLSNYQCSSVCASQAQPHGCLAKFSTSINWWLCRSRLSYSTWPATLLVVAVWQPKKQRKRKKYGTQKSWIICSNKTDSSKQIISKMVASRVSLKDVCKQCVSRAKVAWDDIDAVLCMLCRSVKPFSFPHTHTIIFLFFNVSNGGK